MRGRLLARIFRSAKRETVSGRAGGGGGVAASKSRNPSDTAFKQQRLPAWQPLLTPRIVLPLFFAIGLIFAPLGGVLLWASNSVREISIDYTDCAKASNMYSNMATDKYNVRVPGTAASVPRWKYDNDASTCSIEFAVPSDLKPPVFMYYQLTNFYQNHRVYVKSYDAAQLRGDDVDYEKLKYCKPLNKLEDVQDGGKVKPIYPCGLIANSIFNDTIHNPVFRNPPASNVQNMVYEFSPKGIAWKSDLEKFGKSNYKPNDVVPPPSWLARYPQGYNETNFPKLNEDERFIVWMRAAGLPTFRKLYGRNDNNAMLAGVYSMDIDMNFDTTGYGGTKSFVISTSSFMGGRNPALGISYIVVGALCVILGLIFTTRYIRHPRKLGDHTQLSWNGGGHHH